MNIEDGRPQAKPPAKRNKMRSGLHKSGRGKQILICGTVLLVLLFLLNKFFKPSMHNRHIVIGGDSRFKISHSKDILNHERRQLRLRLEKNHTYTFGENIDQVVSTKIMEKKVAEQKQVIKMEFELFVKDIVENGAEVLVKCKKFKIESLQEDGSKFQARLWRQMEKVVVGEEFPAFLASNGTLLNAQTNDIHKKVFIELHKMDALPMELKSVLTIPTPEGEDESIDCLGTRFVKRPSGTVQAEVVLGSPRDGCLCAPDIGQPGSRWSGPDCKFRNQVAGKIVLLKRGKCNFADKLLLAQDSGAIGVIVGDTEDRDLVFMGGTSSKVIIPAVMVRKKDYERLVSKIIELGDGGLIATMRHGLDAFLYNESPSESDVQRGEKAIVDLLGYNYLLEDQLKKRLTIFPDAEVGRGDVWKREIITKTPVPHVNKESFSLVEIKKKAVAGDYRWVARIKLNTKEVPLKDKGNRGTAKAFHPSLISSASTHDLEGGETGYFEVDLKSGIIINGEITQSISGTKAKYKENSEDELDNEFPQDAMIMKVDTNINAKSRICGSSDGFGDCTSIWTE